MAKIDGPEKGDPGNIQQYWNVFGHRQYEAVPDDPNWDLQFPQSVAMFDQMERTDSQVGSVLRAVRQPLLRAKWDLNGEGCRPEVVKHVREDLGLPEPGELVPRKRVSTVVWNQHLREALDALVHGFSVFEQTYRFENGQLHLRKLSQRLATTIERILTDPDGGLKAVIQKPPTWEWNAKPIELNVDRVVVYSHEKRGANWYGTSLLRTAYKDWRILDGATRINAQTLERNGMGVPVVTIDNESERDEAEQLVRDFRAGAEAGIVLKPGQTFQLVGVTGQRTDALPTLREHKQGISRAVLAMFLDLGHDTGARSLGETFIDVFAQALQGIADWVAATATDHIIRDLVVNAYGPDEPYPILTPGDLADQRALLPADLALLVEKGVIRPDVDLEAFTRQRAGLPERGTPYVTPEPLAVSEPSVNDTVPSPAESPDIRNDDTLASDEDVAEHVTGLLGRLRKLARRQ